jgi:plasmid maintenance system antidote protein VapI
VAESLGIDPAALSYLLNGSRHLRVQEAVQLARILDVPLRVVLERWGLDVGPGDWGRR